MIHTAQIICPMSKTGNKLFEEPINRIQEPHAFIVAPIIKSARNPNLVMEKLPTKLKGIYATLNDIMND